MEQSARPVWAVVDIGSNSLRLVVYRVETTGFLTLLTNLKHAVRLSEHIDERGYLTERAITILVDTLKAFREALSVWNSEQVDIVATAPLRYARNYAEVVAVLRGHVGWTVRILRGEEEAHYAFLAAAHTTYVEDGIAVDMGGGSTELALYRKRRCVAYASLPFGALLLTQRFPSDEGLSDGGRDRIQTFLRQAWKDVPWLGDCGLPVVGIGGTVRSLGKTYSRSCASPVTDTHQGTIPRQIVVDWANRIASLSIRGRRRDLGLPRGRTVIAAPASLALGSLLQHANSPALVICRGGLREGMLYERLRVSHQGTLPAERSLAEVVRRHGGCGMESPLVVTVDLLVRRLVQVGWLSLEEGEHQKVLRAASLTPLYEHDRRDTSRFSQMLNWSWDGFSHLEQCQLLWIASPGDPSWRAHRLWWNQAVTYAQRCRLQQLAAVISLARALTWTQRVMVKDILCTTTDEGVSELTIHWLGNAFLEKQRCDVAKRHLERSLRRSFVLHFVC